MKKNLYVKPTMKVCDIPRTMILCGSPNGYPGPFEILPYRGSN